MKTESASATHSSHCLLKMSKSSFISHGGEGAYAEGTRCCRDSSFSCSFFDSTSKVIRLLKSAVSRLLPPANPPSFSTVREFDALSTDDCRPPRNSPTLKSWRQSAASNDLFGGGVMLNAGLRTRSRRSKTNRTWRRRERTHEEVKG